MNIFEEKARRLERKMGRIILGGLVFLLVAIVLAIMCSVNGNHAMAAESLIWALIIDQVTTKIRNQLVDEYNRLDDLAQEHKNKDGKNWEQRLAEQKEKTKGGAS
jgi:hypothetical protein